MKGRPDLGDRRNGHAIVLPRVTSLDVPAAPAAPPHSPHPPPQFDIGTMIHVPAQICECGVARIVGMEPGPNSRRRCPTWLYYVQFYVGTGGRHVAPAEGWFQATEEEVVQWQEAIEKP